MPSRHHLKHKMMTKNRINSREKIIKPLKWQKWDKSIEHYAIQTLSVEKSGAVPYRDLVTILRLASTHFITKLAMLQSHKSWSPLPLYYKVMCPLDASVRIVTKSLYRTAPSFSILNDCSLLNHSSLHIGRNSFPSYEDVKILDMLFTFQNTPRITLGNEQCIKLLLVVCNTKKRETSLYLWIQMTHREGRSMRALLNGLFVGDIAKQLLEK